MSISFFETVISPKAIDLAVEVLRSGWVSEGFRVGEFEEALAREYSLSHPVAVNSGTSALHLALVLAGVTAGDEVVVPPQTFVATAHAVLMQQATPVFADIDPLTGNLAAASVKAVLSERTKAVIAVHWAGYPCELDALGEVASRNNLVLIEDAAHAFGAAYRGRAIGTVSRFTCFSFQAIKHVTCGDGGALCCLDPVDAADARRGRWFGIDRGQAGPFELGERESDIQSVGFKYHMNDLAAAVGLGNLAGFRDRLARRREIAARYRREFEGVPGLTLLRSDEGHDSASWLFTVLVEQRSSFVRALEDRGVPTSVVHRRIDRHRVFGGIRDLAGQRHFDERQISLPLHSSLSDREVQQVVDVVRAGW
jgi:perosamine synthetase